LRKRTQRISFNDLKLGAKWRGKENDVSRLTVDGVLDLQLEDVLLLLLLLGLLKTFAKPARMTTVKSFDNGLNHAGSLRIIEEHFRPSHHLNGEVMTSSQMENDCHEGNLGQKSFVPEPHENDNLTTGSSEVNP
jgi:hypothetical protein